jgi:uncharacterized protein (TIGR03437 family)
MKVSGKIGLWCSTAHQPYALVLSQDQIKAPELLVNRSDNTAFGDVFAPRGGLWPGVRNLYFSTVTATTGLFTQVSYRVPDYLTTDHPAIERVIGIGDTVTMQFSDGPVIGKVTKAPLVYPCPHGDREFMYLEIMPAGSSKPVYGVVELLNNGKFQVVIDLRPFQSIDRFSFQAVESPTSERRLWISNSDVISWANDSPFFVASVQPDTGYKAYPYNDVPADDSLRLFGSNGGSFSNVFSVPGAASLFLVMKTRPDFHPGLVAYFDRVIELPVPLTSTPQLRFDIFSNSSVSVIGKMACNNSFCWMAAQQPEIGGNFSLNPQLPNVFLASSINEFPNGFYDPGNAVWSWGPLVKQGDPLPWSEIVATLSPAFSGSGPCGASFSTLTGGFNGGFSNTYGVSMPCVTAPSGPVPTGSQFELTGDNLTFLGLSTKIFFDGGQYELPCSSITRAKALCTLTAVRGGQTYPLESVGRVSLYVSVVDKDGNESRSPIFRITLAPPLPTISAVVHGGSFLRVPLAPGTWFSVLGANLGTKATASDANTFQLGGASITVCGFPAILNYNSGATQSAPDVSSWQINALMPNGVFGHESCPVVVTVSGQQTAPYSVSITDESLELFQFVAPASGSAPALVLPVVTHADYSLVGPLAYSTQALHLTPAKAGEIVILWGTGCKATTNAAVSINGTPAQLLFAGITGLGLCQLNIVVPPDTPPGTASLTLPDPAPSYKLAVQ